MTGVQGRCPAFERVWEIFYKRSLKIQNKKPKNGSLSASEQSRNAKLARRRIVVEHVIGHLKKWQILAARYRGHLDHYAQIFQTIAGTYNLSYVK